MHLARWFLMLVVLSGFASGARAGAGDGSGDGGGRDNWGEYAGGTDPTNGIVFLLDVSNAHIDGHMGVVAMGDLQVGETLTDLGNMVTTVNRAYIEYPFLDSATVKVVPYVGSPEEYFVVYRQGAYSNQVAFALPPGVSNAYFRLRSPDADPTNAVMEYCSGNPAGPWSPLVE